MTRAYGITAGYLTQVVHHGREQETGVWCNDPCTTMMDITMTVIKSITDIR
jgi:hypothetical protein